MAWTEERISDLVRLWDAGHSASHIGNAIGVTKNAVIGKAHRLKLPARPSPIRHATAPSTPKPNPKPVSVSVSAPKPLIKARPKPVVRAARAPRAARAHGVASCLWPIGDPSTPDFHFCGAEAEPGKPYCSEHCARAYVSRPRAEPKAA